MNSEELYSFLSVIRRERPDNITRIFFVKKASRLQSFEPQVSCDIQKRILDTIEASGMMAVYPPSCQKPPVICKMKY